MLYLFLETYWHQNTSSLKNSMGLTPVWRQKLKLVSLNIVNRGDYALNKKEFCNSSIKPEPRFIWLSIVIIDDSVCFFENSF